MYKEAQITLIDLSLICLSDLSLSLLSFCLIFFTFVCLSAPYLFCLSDLSLLSVSFYNKMKRFSFKNKINSLEKKILTDEKKFFSIYQRLTRNQ